RGRAGGRRRGRRTGTPASTPPRPGGSPGHPDGRRRTGPPYRPGGCEQRFHRREHPHILPGMAGRLRGVAPIGWGLDERAGGVNELIDTTEMYLRTIYELEEEGIVPLRARIAERLGQSGPTVSQTVARM